MVILDILRGGYIGRFRGLGLFWSCYRFQGYFGHFRYFRGILVILEIYGYFGHFFRFRVYFGYLRFCLGVHKGMKWNVFKQGKEWKRNE